MVPASVSLEFFRFLTELEKKNERKSPQGVGKPFPCPTASYPGCHWADLALNGGEVSNGCHPYIDPNHRKSCRGAVVSALVPVYVYGDVKEYLGGTVPCVQYIL